MNRLPIASLLALLSVASTAQAGGLIHTLPADGSWVKYSMSMKNVGATMIEASGTLTVRTVGTVTENGEKCRWIELESLTTQDGKQKSGVMKLLIREKDFAADAIAAPTILRGWKKSSEKAIAGIDENDKAEKSSSTMFFGKAGTNVKPLKQEKIIDHQKGKLTIASGLTGELKFDPTGGKKLKGIEFNTIQSHWTHKSLPFGTGAMELVMKVNFNGATVSTMTMKFTMLDYGTGAKSVLPDKK